MQDKLGKARLAVDQREGAQRSHGLVEPVTRERLAEFFARLGKQKQWDRLRRQQRGVDDQWLGGGVQLGKVFATVKPL
jgi:hypothetical protein